MLAQLVPDAQAFARAIAAHDQVVAAHGLGIWLGNEPTFTLMQSTAPEWTTEAIGAEKTERARRIAVELAKQAPHAVLLRSIGRKYAGESEPRFSFGIFGRRDGLPFYDGPPDPWLTSATGTGDLLGFSAELATELQKAGLACRAFTGTPDSGLSDLRLIFARDPNALLPDPLVDGRLLRASIYDASTPGPSGCDDLANEGLFLLQLRPSDEGSDPVLELPAVPDLDLFCTVLACAARAGRAAALPTLILCGFPPPVTAECSFLTVTPDPAVVEINMPPFATISEFLAQNRSTYAAAAAAGLTPYRLRHNGVVADSGGGGQITFGGSSPTESPFLRVPQLLPRLLRYVLRHPCFSYLFAHDYVGASGQSVRPDERGADTLAELRLSLALLEAQPNVDAGTLWQSLAPCLTDPTGNAHRTELNVEKLWNPAEPGRGQLGLVEMRALRMQDTPERAAALGALMRALIAMLMVREYHDELPDHGALLHDRFALPYFLEADLEEVLGDLTAAGFGFEEPLEAELRRDGYRELASVECAGVRLTLRRGLEFWPLVGDVTLQQGTSRLVDASTARLELVLRATNADGERLLDGFELRALGHRLPLRSEAGALGIARVFGVRYRSFVPLRGLHPLLGEQSPLLLSLSHPELDQALELSLYDWKPTGGGYDALPSDIAEARSRRAERCVTRSRPRAELGEPRAIAPRALSAYSLDLRYPSTG
ncbi:MAG TPA: transglutaminase family protein [Polyangiaceae bacterium]